MEFDDEAEGDAPRAPLLPPDDRLWRHPSERALLGPVAAALAPDAGESRPGDTRIWAVALLAGVVGALLAAGVGYAAGGVRTKLVPVPAVERDLLSPATFSDPASPSGFVAGAQQIREACVVLVAHDAHGIRMSAGVVVRSDGLVLTTAHTVNGAQSLAATIGGSRHAGARVIASDSLSDLALVRLDGHGYDAAPLGSALDLRIGDAVLALRPSSDTVPGDQASVTALGRQIPGPGGHPLDDLMQLTMASAPSLVGGPLIDRHGAVVGITVAPGGSAGAYATPIDLARAVEQQLLLGSRVVPVWLGIEGTDLPPERARALGAAGGAIVTKLSADGPAQAAGLRVGDVIVGLDGRVVMSMANLIMALHARPPGTRVELSVNHDGQERTVAAELTPRP